MEQTWLEKTEPALRGLYESHGYRRYHMGKLESYDLYLENKSFLTGGQVITFPDGRGRLTALKPDVTMSIVKSTLPEDTVRKLYYSESVFRVLSGTGECRELKQLGVESIGPGGMLEQGEILLLAAGSLALMTPDWALTLGHMGFAQAVLSDALEPEQAQRALALLGDKALPELEALLDGVPAEKRPAADALLTTAGPAKAALEALSALELEGEAAAALAELRTLTELLAPLCPGDRLRIDFSAVGAADYYNGVLFHGYVRGAAAPVLSGGRYDKLMRRFGKPQSAIGFAMYMNELAGLFPSRPETDVDVLLLCPGAEPAAALAAAEKLRSEGLSVLLSPAVPRELRAGRTLALRRDGTLEEVAPC